MPTPSSNPNSIPRVLGRMLRNWAIIFSLPICALLINRWSHTTASVLAHLWLIILVISLFMSRPPAFYNSYGEWWADRANWWKPFKS